MAITRTRVLLRAQYGWPRKSVPFENFGFKGDYRTNAAGFVSMCWDIPAAPPAGGPNNVTLLTEGWVHEIESADLKPGDAIGYLGPQSMDLDGSGVIVIFEKWLEDDPRHGVALTWEHLPITSPGPDRRARPIDFRWHCYRFKDIVD